MAKKPVVYSPAEKREFLVVKRNDLIQKSRHQLTVQEQKIILYLVSCIKPDDKDFMEHTFSIPEFCRVCGINYDNGGNYVWIKKTVKKLCDRSTWITMEDGSETLFRWLDDVTISPDSTTIKMTLGKHLKPFLLKLKKNFTQFNLNFVLLMKSQYSIRLYELLKSHAIKRRVTLDADDLKRLLDAQTYKSNYDFKRRVIEPAIEEINELSDIIISHRYIMSGRTFSEVEFFIRMKNDKERMATFSLHEKGRWLPQKEKEKREKEVATRMAKYGYVASSPPVPSDEDES